MKSMLLILVTTLISFSAAAADTALTCPDSIDGIVTIIQQSGRSCSEASTIASQCAYGSSADIHIAGAAREVCLKEAGTLSKSDIALLSALDKRCNKAYEKKEGTMYLSMNAFCQLGAANFINQVQNKEGEL